MPRRVLLAAALLVLVAPVVAPIVAQSQERTYKFDLPAEALGDALRTFGQVAHQQIIFSEEAVRGKRSSRLVGSFTVDQALRLLLGTTGLQVRRTSDGVIYIDRSVS